MWDKVQFHCFDVWSDVLKNEGGSVSTDDYTPIAATLNVPGSGYFGDIPTAYADAVGTFRRAHVGFTPNELYRSMWVDTSDISPVLTITGSNALSGSGTQTRAILQFSCVLRSTAQTGPPTGAEVVIAGHHKILDEGLIDNDQGVVATLLPGTC